MTVPPSAAGPAPAGGAGVAVDTGQASTLQKSASTSSHLSAAGRTTPPLPKSASSTSPPGSPSSATQTRPPLSTYAPVNMTLQTKVYETSVACSKLEETSHAEDERTCPGLFMVVRAPSQEEGKFRLVKTDGLGKASFVNFEKTATGYTNGSHAPNFQALVKHLCVDVQPVLGRIFGIPYYSKGDARSVLKMVTEATKPTYEIFMRKEDTRLILVWRDPQGQVHAAHIHYVFPTTEKGSKGYWQNGGPSPLEFLPPVSTLPPPPSSFRVASTDVKDSSGGTDGLGSPQSGDASSNFTPPQRLHLDELVYEKVGYDSVRLLYAIEG